MLIAFSTFSEVGMIRRAAHFSKKAKDFLKQKRKQHSQFMQERSMQRLRNTVFVSLGVISAAFGLKGFLIPNHFIDGGVTGVSLLLGQLTNVPVPILLIAINLPFVYLGFKQMGRKFGLKTISSIVGLSIALYLMSFPVVTSDKLLISVFGGFFLGLGIGLCMRGGCVIDGTEILSLYISRKTGISVGDIILGINVVIFSFAAFTLGLESAFYSLLTYLSAAKTVDFLAYGLDEYIGVMVISQKSDSVRKYIVETLGKGATILKGMRGFGRINGQLGNLDIIYTVTTKLELTNLKDNISQIDQTAFLIMHSVHDVKGGIIKKRPFH